MTDIAKLGLSVNAEPVDKATASLTNFQKVSSSTEKSVKRNLNGMADGFRNVRVQSSSTQAPIKSFTDNATKATKVGGGFANQARQMSLQLSQVAQQGAATGNYLQALAIQLPDLLLGFGTLGILIGAAAGALGGPLINALTGASREAKEFEGAIDDVIGSLQSVRLEKTIGTIETLTDKIKENEAELSRLNEKTFKKMGGRALSNARRLELQAKNQEKINALEKEQARNNEALLELEKRRAEIETEDDVEAQKKKNELLEAELRLQSDLANVEGQLDPNVAVINAAQRRLEIINEAAKQEGADQAKFDALRLANAQKLSDDLIAIEKRTQDQSNAMLTAGQEAALGYSAQLFGNLASIAREGGEDQFQEYKNLASAQAAIAAALAVTKTLTEAPYPLNVALAGSIGALAAVQIAQIQSQEYSASRASGGQATGRVLVGENGPEILNLGSQTGHITSHAGSKGMMGGNNVTQVFQISAGVQGTVRSEIMAAVPLIRKVASQTVISESRKGGAMSRAVGAR